MAGSSRPATQLMSKGFERGGVAVTLADVRFSHHVTSVVETVRRHLDGILQPIGSRLPRAAVPEPGRRAAGERITEYGLERSRAARRYSRDPDPRCRRSEVRARV